MSTTLTYAHVVQTPRICGGRPRIDGHRVRVQDIAVEHDWEGLTPEQICREHPGLTLAHVHAALAYYYDNREAILADIECDRRMVEQFKTDHPDTVR